MCGFEGLFSNLHDKVGGRCLSSSYLWKMGLLDGVADGGFGQCVMPRLSRCVSGGGLYYILCNDVMGPLSTLLLNSARSLFA